MPRLWLVLAIAGCEAPPAELCDALDWFADADDDGWGSGPVLARACLLPAPELVPFPGDCDDADPLRAPGLEDVLGNGVDDDCDPATGDHDAGDAFAALEITEPVDVEGIGDLTGDGLDDLGVSQRYGLAWVVSGAVAGGGSLEDAGIALSAPSGWGVQRLTAAGDIDGDGRDDLVVAVASGADPTDVVWILNGPVAAPTAVGDRGVVLRTSALGAVTLGGQGVGDVDGDGLADIAIAERTSGPSRVYVLTGPWSGDASLDDATAAWQPESDGAGAGYAMSAAGDVDGDGRDDLLVAAPWESVAGERAGAAYVLVDVAAGGSLGDAVGIIRGDEVGSAEGCAGVHLVGLDVDSVGDVNGDGFVDVLVGNSDPDCGGEDNAYFAGFSGPIEGTLDYLDDAAFSYRQFGYTSIGEVSASAGDVDGDGLGDVLLADDYGATWLVTDLGHEEIVLAADAAHTFPSASDVAGLGDVDGDGRPDVAAVSWPALLVYRGADLSW